MEINMQLHLFNVKVIILYVEHRYNNYPSNTLWFFKIEKSGPSEIIKFQSPTRVPDILSISKP